LTFKAAFQEFFTGSLSLAELQSALVAELQLQPDSAVNSLRLIENAYGNGILPVQIYGKLKRIVSSSPSPDDPQARPNGRQGSHDPESWPAYNRGKSAPLIPRGIRIEPRFEQYRESDRTSEASQPEYEISADHRMPKTDPGYAENTGGSFPHAAWTGAEAQHETKSLNVGDTVDGQFILEKVIGRGGMGVVYMARDIKAEAAKDRDPYVALKLLNENFKRHPDSLAALQREAKKAQSLAHPNIVNVYNFDFDDHNAWIVMEYLKGKPLDKISRGSISRKEAFSIIQQLGQALQHAHSQKPPIVHCDFKPANAFLTTDGTVKVLDFGIARAAPIGLEDEGDHTVFDVGKLGALTPSYASCEMLRGFDPDPRDDVYALACVAYGLLSGKHPFHRRSAVDAQAQRLKPPPIKGLKGRQFNALAKGLAFERGKRTGSVRQFIREISPNRSGNRKTRLRVGLFLALLVLGFAVSSPMWWPATQREWQVYQLRQQIVTAENTNIADLTGLILALSTNAKKRLFSDPQVSARVIDYYDIRIEEAFSPAQENYDYLQARALIDEFSRLLPDPKYAEQTAVALEKQKDAALLQQYERRNEAIRKNRLLSTDGADNLPDILDVIRRIDPQNGAFSDAGITTTYIVAAERALQKRDLKRAEALSLFAVESITGLPAGSSREPLQARLDKISKGLSNDFPSDVTPQSSAEVYFDALRGAFNQALEKNELAAANQLLNSMKDQGADNEIISTSTDRLARAYLDKAEKSLAAEIDTVQAKELIDQGLALQPGDRVKESLKELAARVDSTPLPTPADKPDPAQPYSSQDSVVERLRQDLESRLGKRDFRLADVGWSADTLDRINKLGGDTSQDRKRVIQRILATGNQLLEWKELDKAWNLASYSTSVFPESKKIQALADQTEKALQRTQVSRLIREIDGLLGKQNLDSSAIRKIDFNIRRLEAISGERNPRVVSTRRQVIENLLARAEAAKKGGRNDLASRYNQLAASFNPEKKSQALAAGEQKIDTKIPAAALTRAEPGDFRAQYRGEIADGDLENAERLLAQAQVTLNKSDPFLAEARLLLADAYLDEAISAAQRRDYNTAANLVDKSLEISPDHARTKRWQRRITRLNGQPTSSAPSESGPSAQSNAPSPSALVNRELELIRLIFDENAPLNAADISNSLKDLERRAPAAYTEYRPVLVQQLQDSIANIATTDPQTAKDRAAVAKNIFPNEDFPVEEP
jgi:serine/threonine protein kinase